jgi:glutathione peroxidase
VKAVVASFRIVIAVAHDLCSTGATGRNYNDLQQLYDKYASRGFEILAFPCNDFLRQENGSEEQVCVMILYVFVYVN